MSNDPVSTRSAPTKPGRADRPLGEGENFLHLLKRGVQEDIAPSFQRAWDRMQAGSPRLMITKVGSTALGSFMIGDGIYNMISGFDEQVDDLFIPGSEGRNLVRMFVGGTEALTGAAALYWGLTKGATGHTLLK